MAAPPKKRADPTAMPPRFPIRFDSDDATDGFKMVTTAQKGTRALHPEVVEVFGGWRSARGLCVVGFINLCTHFALLHDLIQQQCLYNPSSDFVPQRSPVYMATVARALLVQNPMSQVFGDGDEVILNAVNYLALAQPMFNPQGNVTNAGLSIDSRLVLEGQGWRENTHNYPPRSGYSLRTLRSVTFNFNATTLPRLPWFQYLRCVAQAEGLPLDWGQCLAFQLGAVAANANLASRVAVSVASFLAPLVLIGDPQAHQADVYLCNTSAFPRIVPQSAYDASSAAFSCGVFSLRTGASPCPPQGYFGSLACVEVVACVAPVRAPLALFIVWIAALILVWLGTEPCLCALFQGAFFPLVLNRHHGKYRTLHFWLLVVLLDIPIAAAAVALLYMRLGHVTVTMVAVAATVAANFSGNVAHMCQHLWSDVPPLPPALAPVLPAKSPVADTEALAPL